MARYSVLGMADDEWQIKERNEQKVRGLDIHVRRGRGAVEALVHTSISPSRGRRQIQKTDFRRAKDKSLKQSKKVKPEHASHKHSVSTPFNQI